MKVAVIEGHDIGGTCVNRGCVPSKALLAAAGRIREMKDEAHMKSMGIQVTEGCVLVRAELCVCVCGGQVKGCLLRGWWAVQTPAAVSSGKASMPLLARGQAALRAG